MEAIATISSFAELCPNWSEPDSFVGKHSFTKTQTQPTLTKSLGVWRAKRNLAITKKTEWHMRSVLNTRQSTILLCLQQKKLFSRPQKHNFLTSFRPLKSAEKPSLTGQQTWYIQAIFHFSSWLRWGPWWYPPNRLVDSWMGTCYYKNHPPSNCSGTCTCHLETSHYSPYSQSFFVWLPLKFGKVCERISTWLISKHVQLSPDKAWQYLDKILTLLFPLHVWSKQWRNDCNKK